MKFLQNIEKAITKGIAFLRSKQHDDGLWRDFNTLAGASSDWVSGFVAYILTHNGYMNAEMLPLQKQLLFRQRPNGGWSYNKSVPTDCDSTAWVLLALSTSPDWRPSAIIRATEYLKTHQNPRTGGFSTYILSDGIQNYLRISDNDIIQGWLSSHHCVTSVALQSLLVHKDILHSSALKEGAVHLIKNKNVNDVWESYWWQGHAYSTYHAIKALLLSGIWTQRDLIKTRKYFLSQQLKCGGWRPHNDADAGVFETAFATLTLLLFPDQESLTASKAGIEFLLQQQNKKGDWPVFPILRIPKPMVLTPEDESDWRPNTFGTGVIIEDDQGVFTCAAALWPLMVYRSVIN